MNRGGAGFSQSQGPPHPEMPSNIRLNGFKATKRKSISGRHWRLSRALGCPPNRPSLHSPLLKCLFSGSFSGCLGRRARVRREGRASPPRLPIGLFLFTADLFPSPLRARIRRACSCTLGAPLLRTWGFDKVLLMWTARILFSFACKTAAYCRTLVLEASAWMPPYT